MSDLEKVVKELKDLGFTFELLNFIMGGDPPSPPSKKPHSKEKGAEEENRSKIRPTSRERGRLLK